ncbi:MAG: hypothetical protein R3B70_10780 [Polyangiaceae bacterium]
MEADPPTRLDDPATRDPRGRSHEEWLDVLESLVGKLSEFSGAPIEVGPYWLDFGGPAVSAALGARVRAQRPFPGVASDSWEAALCITGGDGRAHVDVMAFPFLEGSVVTGRGRLADLPDGAEVEELWVSYGQGTWQLRGFRSPDGAGEWDHVRGPGAAFFRRLLCRTTKSAFRPGEGILVRLDHPDFAELAEMESRGAGMVSIHKLWRDRQEIVRPPAAAPLPRAMSSGTGLFVETTPGALADLRELALAGGWGQGWYAVELRVDYSRGAGSSDSDISGPFEFEIALP